jgi:hypothetical protein
VEFERILTVTLFVDFFSSWTRALSADLPLAWQDGCDPVIRVFGRGAGADPPNHC